LTLIHSSNLDFHKGLLQLARAVGNDVRKARRETTYVVATAASSRSAVIAAYLAGVHGPTVQTVARPRDPLYVSAPIRD
jgi:CRISPR/Cas system-associated protein Csm6